MEDFNIPVSEINGVNKKCVKITEDLNNTINEFDLPDRENPGFHS